MLTVSESKRLIAKGVAALPVVQQAMKEGIVVVATGTTNGYVLEELWGQKIDKRRYRSGTTTPKVPEKAPEPAGTQIPDVVFKKGRVAEELNRFTAPAEMTSKDVYIKGANALDYKQKTAGVLIGGGTSGTVGAVLGNLVGKKVNLIIPVGLEKLVYEDLNQLQRLAWTDCEGPNLWPLTGAIITEIEALMILTGVKATLLASGGIAGAEGAVRLILEGTDAQLDAAVKLVDSVKGEPRDLL